MSTQNGNASPYVLVGLALLAVIVVTMLFSGQNSSGIIGAYPLPTSGSEVP